MTFAVATEGFTDIVDVTTQVREACTRSGVEEGIAALFVVGSTAGLTTIEYEPGAVEDLKQALERVAPTDGFYRHNEAWGDGNGYAHVRAALMKPSLTIPIVGGKLILGTWQQIILMDFDNRPRNRTIHVRIAATAA